MKTLIILSLLLLSISCGSNGGGSSAPEIPTSNNEFVPPTPEPTEPAFTPDPAHPVIDYELVVEGCNGAMFDSLSFLNYGSVDESRVDWPGAIGSSGSTNISQVGREIFWNVENIGSCPITMKLYKEENGSTYLIEHLVINPGENKEYLYQM